MILLDTNICIYIINAKPEAVLQRFQQYRLGEIGLCSVVPGLHVGNWLPAV
jgi:tRNA(fMet)-specific endonuclease VapC